MGWFRPLFLLMVTRCTHCQSEAPSEGNFCPNCGEKISRPSEVIVPREPTSDGVVPESRVLDPTVAERLGHGGWGIWPPALGLMALVPTAIVASLLALSLPLATATAMAAVILALFQLGVVWALTSRTWPIRPELYGLRRPLVPYWRSILYCLFAVGASLGAIQLYVMAVIALGFDNLIPADLPSDLLLPGRLAALSIVALAVVTPVAEEIFFRGFVLRGFVNRWGVVPGVLLSAVIFAALHFQPGVIIPVFITGLILGTLYWQTGSIWPGIGVHAAQNLVATVGILAGL